MFGDVGTLLKMLEQNKEITEPGHGDEIGSNKNEEKLKQSVLMFGDIGVLLEELQQCREVGRRHGLPHRGGCGGDDLSNAQRSESFAGDGGGRPPAFARRTADLFRAVRSAAVPQLGKDHPEERAGQRTGAEVLLRIQGFRSQGGSGAANMQRYDIRNLQVSLVVFFVYVRCIVEE